METKNVGLVLLIAFVMAIGGCCFLDDDGENGENGDDDPATIPENGGERSPDPEYVDGGTTMVPPRAWLTLSAFTITREGVIEGKIEWDTAPATLEAVLMQVGGPSQTDTMASELMIYLEVTAAMVDFGDDYEFRVRNASMSDVEVRWRVKFAPE